MIDRTHDARLRSWVPSANAHADFPLQNLPFGIFRRAGQEPRGGIAIGDAVVDLALLSGSGLLSGLALEAAQAASGPALNTLMAMGTPARASLRMAVSALLEDAVDVPAALRACVHDAAGCTLLLPATVRGYTDFYAGIHHAQNVGKLFRPDAPLLPNYRHVPIGYNGRPSSVTVSGGSFNRPTGQLLNQATGLPEYLPSRELDFELELGAWVAQGNAQGKPVSIDDAGAQCWGYSLLNDWSARDIQRWEYQPLGPFLSKSFATFVSPWIVTPEALAPFRAPAWKHEAPPLAYLRSAQDAAEGGIDIGLQVCITTPLSRSKGMAPMALGNSSSQYLYWTFAQMMAHHTSNGCNLEPGDLIGSGTISGPDPLECGSLLERSRAGREPVLLESGESRSFLEDGDEIILSGTCKREGFAPIGFGACVGRVQG